MLAESPDRQPILFLALEGFFAGEKSPYDTAELAGDTLAFAMAADALLGLALPNGGPFIWAADWEMGPAVLLLGARHTTAMHLHNVYDQWLGGVLPQFSFPQAASLERDTALRAALGAADVTCAVNPGFADALHDPAWPVYTDVLAPHLQDVLGRVTAVTNGPFSEMRPAWIELMHAFTPDSHAAGRRYATCVGERRSTALTPELRRLIMGRMIVLIGGRSVTQKLPEVAVAAARRTLERRRLPVFFVFAYLPGDEFSARRHAELCVLRDDFPRDVLVLDDEPALYAAFLDVADAQVFSSAWEPHGSVFHGLSVPIAFGEGPCAQIHSWRSRGRAVEWQARFHRKDEPRNGWWLYPEPVQPAEVTRENWRAIVSAPPEAGNGVYGAMVDQLHTALHQAVSCWSSDPIAFAGIVLAALRKQAAGDWAARDSYGRMFELIASVDRRPSRAA
jgi:hypothetical protein